MKYGLSAGWAAAAILLFAAGTGFGQTSGHQSFTGSVRDISSSELTIRTTDRRIVGVVLENTTRFLKQSRSPMNLADFNPGDQVTIDATQDDAGLYHAATVTLLQQATPADRSAVTSAAPRGTASSNATPGDDDPDRPRLRRKDSSDATVKPQVLPGDTNARAKPVQNAPAQPDPDDPGPPRLAHGTPRNSAPPPSSPQIEAQSRPSIGAQEVNGVTQREAPPAVGPAEREPANDSAPQQAQNPRMPSSGDPVIDKTRVAAFSFSETLPNYVVKQFTTRYETRSAKGQSTNWQALDTISADVVYENGKESYKNLQVNGKPSRLAPEETGAWSTGEFATLMQAIVSPVTDTEFRNKRATTIVNRPAWRYDFEVQQPRSSWHVTADKNQSYVPGYTGSIWIDQETFRILRIEQSARNMPSGFPLDTVESAVDYDYVLIGSSRFILPVHSENLSCDRGTADCTRNVIDFRNYRKFGADSEISFGATEPAGKDNPSK